jgi:uncharacterized DUF497 family protein
MEFAGFDWDRGNRKKCQKHGLSIAEIESLFDRPVMILPTAKHSGQETRFRAIGHTATKAATLSSCLPGARPPAAWS